MKSKDKYSTYSCADCGAGSCTFGDGKNPSFCVSRQLTPQEVDQSIAQYQNEQDGRLMAAAAAVEAEHYCTSTRVEDTIHFAKKMGYQKLGVATCVGLLHETRILSRILRSHGFQVFAVSCKAGEYRKTDLGLPEEYTHCGQFICNPVLQAQLLNREGTDMNIIMGLCVGHDMLFTKHSLAPVTTLVAKDRVLAHNPVGALYQADVYYKNKLRPPQAEE